MGMDETDVASELLALEELSNKNESS